MTKMKMLSAKLMMMALVLGGSMLMAQQPVPQTTVKASDLSKEDLQKFADANKEVQKIQMDFQQEMMNMMKDQGIDPQTFSEMARAEQSGSADTANYTADQKKAYATVMAQVATKQQELSSKVEDALKKYGLTIETFQAEARTISQSPEMKQQVMDMMQEDQGQ